MAENYFGNFPAITYPRTNNSSANVVIKDITRRTTVTANTVAGTSAVNFYPYELTDSLRSDHVAEFYYNNGELEWLVQLTNQNIDPYYGWYNDYTTFETVITEKYGTEANAKQKVKYYINNWADDDRVLTPEYHNSSLPEVEKKFWKPQFGPNFDILGYERKRDDITMNTNQIWQFEISANTGELQVGEIVDVFEDGSEIRIGSGEVTLANSTFFRIHNVSGNLTANSSLTLNFIGNDSLANYSTANSEQYFINIANSEFAYYSPVYFYDFEEEQNEARKDINLIGDTYADQYVNEFERLMLADVDIETGLVEN